MTTGFSKTLDLILRKYGLKTDGVMGATVLADKTNKRLMEMGYLTAKGLYYDKLGFVYLSQAATDMPTIIEAFEKLDVGCILIFRPCCVEVIDVVKILGPVSVYTYGKNKKIGVLLKTA